MSKMVKQNLSTNQLYTGFILTKSMRVRCAVWKLIQLLSTKPKKLKKKSSTYWMVELDGGMMRKCQWTSWKNILIGHATKQLVNFWLHRTTCCSVIPIASSILFSANSTQILSKDGQLSFTQKGNGIQISGVSKHTKKLLHMMQSG